MIVHEYGHYLGARLFGMRVDRFSIGIGPKLLERKPADSETTYQLALIPFMAYVQIAGMNPMEPVDKNDKGSYANAGVIGRLVAIAGGPAANYLAATLIFFGVFFSGGKPNSDPTRVVVEPGGSNTPALEAGVRAGDRMVAINGTKVVDWMDFATRIGGLPGQRVDLEVERDGAALHLFPTPKADASGKGKIMVAPGRVPVDGIGEATMLALKEPALVVWANAQGLAQMFKSRSTEGVSSVFGLVKDMKEQFAWSLGRGMILVALVSASLAFFNLLPFPGLDGARLLFLGYELVTKKRPNEKFEAGLHMSGVLTLLSFMAFVAARDIWRWVK